MEPVAEHIASVRSHALGDMLRRTCKRYPTKVAFVYKDRTLTFRELDQTVNALSHGLRAAGVDYGSRVAILSRNNLNFVLAMLAMARVGAIAVPINYMLTESEVRFIANHARIVAGFAETATLKTLQNATEGNLPIYLLDDLNHPSAIENLLLNQPTTAYPSPVISSDVAQILYTSGTESRPKGAMLTHEALISECLSAVVDVDMATDDIAVHALPLYHSAQLNVFLLPYLYVGATSVILTTADSDAILQAIETHRATQLFCPPTVWIALLRSPAFAGRDLTSLRKCAYGASIMPGEVLKELSERLPGVRLWNLYGQTEVAPLATVLRPEDQFRKFGSAGLPALHVETAIIDDSGSELPPGEIGEIAHRTPHAMIGYLDDPEKTAAAFANGYFRSGDLGKMDEDGYLYVIDRKKDMIKTGGVNVASREVEDALYTHPGIAEVAVIGVPDPYWIERVTAVVVARAGMAPTEEEVLAHGKQHLASFKVPKTVHFVSSLPKNPSGKILKRELRAKFSDEPKVVEPTE